MNADELTIPGIVERAAERFADAEALVDGDLRLTFTQLAERIDHAARALIARGVEPGDRVAVWAPNRAEWVFAALGAHRCGAVVVPLNTRFKGGEAGDILRRSGACLLFTVTDFLGTNYVDLLRAAAVPASVEEIIVMAGPPTAGTTGWAEFTEGADRVPVDEAAKRAAAIDPDDLCDILFTSGTTGAPKGAMLRHGATIRAFTSWSDVVGLSEGDRYLIINPFFHAFGLKAGIVASLVKGATIIPHPVFDVDTVMARVAEERVTMLPGPPAIYQTILDHPDLERYDLSSLRLAVTGAATVPVEMIRRMRAELTFKNIVTGYGLTESTGVATMCRHTDDADTIATTAGRPLPGTEVRVIGDDGQPRPAGEPGEVVVRGYHVMAGYYEDPDATAETIDRDGWLHTGDIGVIDQEGNLRITDRTKDMFIVGGFNAYPAEIEQIMMRHPTVGQVAVVGVPDHRLGEVGRAFVVARAGQRIDADTLITWCREHMANYKVPRSVEIVDALPLNASGKVLKYRLRQQAGGG